MLVWRNIILILLFGVFCFLSACATNNSGAAGRSLNNALVSPDLSQCDLVAMAGKAREVILKEYPSARDLLNYAARVTIYEDHLVFYFDPTEGNGNSNSPEIVFDRYTCEFLGHYFD